MDLLFLPESHQYFLTRDGEVVEELDHVTGILESCGLSDYSDVPSDKLEWSKKRGTAVHLACQYYDEGDLDESALHPEVRPRVEAYKKFRQESGFQIDPGGIERQVFSEIHRFAGTIDRIGTLKARPAILDLKTPVQKKLWWGAQLAGYEILLGGSYDRYTLQLFESGDYLLLRWADPNERKYFLAANTVAKLKRMWNGR